MSNPSIYLITGVSRGLGWGLASAALQQGARVIGCSRSQPEAFTNSSRLTFVQGDLTRKETIDCLVEAVEKAGGKVDAVILNAAVIGKIGELKDTSTDAMAEVMEINAWASKRLLDGLLATARRISQVVAISSGASINAYRGWANYSLSKRVLNGLMEFYALECPDTHFSSLAPGLIDSAMQDYLTGLPSDPRYPALETLKTAKGTDDMPTPEVAGERIFNALDSLRKHPSGSYLDIRTL